MKKWCEITFVAGMSVSWIANATTVTGKVNFKGPTPPAGFIQMSSDPGCAKANAGKKISKQEVVVNNNGTLSNVFVYVKEGVKKDALPPAASEPLVLDQKGCMYKPHVFGLRVGQPLKIVNSDPFMHNVHGMGKANPQFNRGMVSDKVPPVEIKFTKTETMMKVKCDVHGWMSTYVGVVDHPYFGVTDTTGNFNINELPPGEYTLEAWHEKLGSKIEKIKVSDGMKPVEFTFGGPA